ncbi:flagellin [Stakelama pacifica]|uniref:Flagellin n=1 Tax=Stakelama pacifica TaxID=517720 RepID=A0A4R6FIF0_9SPHN|nr:flagellin [Stakelama pacifica]MAW98527.1 flagellin [Sphingomonas sp.]TDN81172.1 flagellin [Stakelama pacifica]GGO96966.1 flagellin [Stakelama pacifica]
MGFSVNTNVGAMAALQSLNATNKGLATTQSRINTGLSVASTKDDSAAYTVAQTLRGDLGGLTAVNSSLSRAKSTVDVATAGAEQISDLVNQMKAKATEASDAGLDADSRTALGKDFDALKSQISTIIDSSEFNGTNLLKASGGTVNALQSTDTTASTLDVANQDFSAIVTAIGTTFSDAATAKTMVGTLETQAKAINGKLSTLGAAGRKIEGQQSFISKLSDVIESGVGNLVDADLAKESARLQALQVKQQLGVQALSIANQAPQTITSLFR